MNLRAFFIRWCWAVGATAMLIVVLTPAPAPDRPLTPPAMEAWTPPQFAAAGNAVADLAELGRGNLWGLSATADNAVDERALRWRLAGIAGKAGDRLVIVQFGDERTLPLKAGDHFPDGTLIGEIRDNGVCVIIDGKKRLLPMPGQTIPIIW